VKVISVAQREDTHGVCDTNVVRWCPLPSHEHILATAGDDQAVRVWAIRANT